MNLPSGGQEAQGLLVILSPRPAIYVMPRACRAAGSGAREHWDHSLLWCQGGSLAVSLDVEVIEVLD